MAMKFIDALSLFKKLLSSYVLNLAMRSETYIDISSLAQNTKWTVPDD